MKHVFIAVGSSGTKVAEALVRLLAAGFPTRLDEKGILTSAGDSLQIWIVDPVENSGAAQDLNDSLKLYKTLQEVLSDGDDLNSLAGSRWGMDIETVVRHLDPMDLPRKNDNDNAIKTLRGVLDSRYTQDIQSSLPLLAPFYSSSDLDIPIKDGFFQRPFIGAAIMSIFAKSLEDEASPGGRKSGLSAFKETPTNFFLCGSLHGGTGACGVPMVGQFLHNRKSEKPTWNWRVGGCLLGPYLLPPRPPFSSLTKDEEITDAQVKKLMQEHGNHPAFASLNTEEEKTAEVKRILRGEYADPDEMIARARQGLEYYKNHGADYFDELYLVSKPTPNKLKTNYWSNKGVSQRNPSNSAEFVGALAALNFFAKANTGNLQSYVLGSSDLDLKQVGGEKLRLFHLPTYKIGETGREVDPEKVILSLALTHYLLLYQMPWDKVHESVDRFELCKFYDGKEERKNSDQEKYKVALDILAHILRSVVPPHNEDRPTGWSNEDLSEINAFLSSNEGTIKEIQNRLAIKKRFGIISTSEAVGANTLGQSAVKFTTFDFGKWCPQGDQFTRGEYLRYVWNKIFALCQTQR